MTDSALDPALLGIVERVDGVRRRLVIASLLRSFAVFLGAALLFIIGYAWIDHHFHLGAALRVLALLIMASATGYGLYRFVSDLRHHIALEHAARYIEARSTYRQQLLATVEYYANRENYAYSEALAQFMVRQVAQQTAQTDWLRLIPRWPQWLSAAIILFGTLATLWMAATNGAYFAHYLGRLVQPTAAIAPLPATTLTLTTGDIIVAERTSFEMAADIGGRLPEQGTVLLSKPGDDTTPGAVFKRIELKPLLPEDGAPRLALLTQLPLGEYAYRFEADQAQTEQRSIRIRPLPELEKISARVVPPEVLGIDPYDEVIDTGVLNVIEGADVTLTLTASVPLSSGTVQWGESDVESLAAPVGPILEYSFTADLPRALAFTLTSDEGLANDTLPPIAVVLSKDEDPAFTYASPGADYLATNVASIPLEINVQDDFGLTGAALVVEIDGQAPLRFPAVLEDNTKEAALAHVLELEDYNLEVGDTILVYAEASDVKSALKVDENTTRSEVNFIEIRAYNQIFHQAKQSMGGGLNMPRGLDGERLPTLLQVLEYTRAIMKKTWTLQDAVPYNEEATRKAESVATDAEFIADKLGKIQQAVAGRVTPEQQKDMGTVEDALLEASPFVRNEDIEAALEPTKTAYRIMRRLVDELEKGEIPPGSGSTRELMEGIKLEEKVHLTRFEDEQVQWELKKLAEDLDSIRQKQKELGRRFERFLQAQAKQEGHKQDITDEESKTQKNLNKQDGAQPPSASGGGSESSRMTSEGSLLPPEGGGSGESQVSPEEMLEMLQAAQSDLAERAAAVEAELERMAKLGTNDSDSAPEPGDENGGDPTKEGAGEDDPTNPDDSGQGRDGDPTSPGSGESGSGSGASTRPGDTPRPGFKSNNPGDQKNRDAAGRAADRLAEARAAMNDLSEAARESYFQTGKPGDTRESAREALEKVADSLGEAANLMEGIIDRDIRDRTVALLAAQAETAAEIARAMAETTDPITQERLQRELAELTATGHSGGTNYVQRFGGAGTPPLYVALVDSIVAPADKSSIPEFIDAEPRRAARYIAEKFWSLAIDAQKERGSLRSDDASDATFSQPERTFFESAAYFEEGAQP